MKITYETPDGQVKERVVTELTHFYLTESGAQVAKSSVILTDRRGGKRPGAGNKPNSDKCAQVPVYLKRKHLEQLRKEAEDAGMSISSYINKKLGF